MGVTSVRLKDDVQERLEEAATRLRRSKGWLINEALAEYLAREERREQVHRETLEGLADIESGRLVEAEPVHDWLRSWGAEKPLPPPRFDD